MHEVIHKTYLSYHPEDQSQVERFLEQFDHLNNLAIQRPPGELEQDIEREDDKHKLIHKMRQRYLKDSTVTLLLLGPCTYTQRSVDLELLASLHHGQDVMADPNEDILPNGLVAVMLPHYQEDGFPDRLNENLRVSEDQPEPYARVIPYPEDKMTLAAAIKDAHTRRETLLPNNTPAMQSEDKACL